MVGFRAFVGELFRAGGPATKVNTHCSLANQLHDVQARLQVKEALQYPAVVFNGHQAHSIANGFAQMAAKAQYQVYACAILPEHVHLALGRYRYAVETMVRLLKAEATTQLSKDGRHPLARYQLPDGSVPSPWERTRWKVFLEDDEGIVAAIAYVEQNPIKEGKRPQHWQFVVPFTTIMV